MGIFLRLNRGDVMYCEHCGKKIDLDSVFCEHCGKKIKKINKLKGFILI